MIFVCFVYVSWECVLVFHVFQSGFSIWTAVEAAQAGAADLLMFGHCMDHFGMALVFGLTMPLQRSSFKNAPFPCQDRFIYGLVLNKEIFR